MTMTSDAKPKTLSWTVGGMDCASCAATIRGAVDRLPGVSDVKLSVMTETMTLALDEAQTTRAAIGYCLAHPQWRLSVQTHKVVGVR